MAEQYEITLAIGYTYGSPALAARTLLRMRPLSNGRQTLLSGRLDATPVPAQRVDEVDFFGNAMTAMTFADPLMAVEFRFEGRVLCQPVEPGMDLSCPLALLPEQIAAAQSLSPDAPHHFLGASERVKPEGAIAVFVREATKGAQTTLEAVQAVSKALHKLMTFDPTATDVATEPAEAFAKRRGVCQDFSHIMISGLRAIGIPAGYVSGFLRTLPPEGQERLEGADAMHAWVRAWCGQQTGWIEIDPTNDMLVGSDHVSVAVGRDYADVAPVKGSLRSAGIHTTTHSVDMITFEEAERKRFRRLEAEAAAARKALDAMEEPEEEPVEEA